MKPLAWILLSIPVYLLVKGKLSDYIALAAKKSAGTTATGGQS